MGSALEVLRGTRLRQAVRPAAKAAFDPTPSLTGRAHDGGLRDGNPPAGPARRRFHAQYKLAIPKGYEGPSDWGAKGALLRWEGPHSSHLVEWRRARDTGAISGLAATHRKKRSDTERQLENAKKKVERVEDRLDRHRKALEAQGTPSEPLARLWP